MQRWSRFAIFVLFKAQDFYWPKIYFTKFKKSAFPAFFEIAVFRCSFWFLAVFVVVTIVLVYRLLNVSIVPLCLHVCDCLVICCEMMCCDGST